MTTRRNQQKRRTGALHIPEAVAHAIAAVVDYCWRDEARDFQARKPDERDSHIYRELVVIRRWLKRNDVPTQCS